MTDYTGVGSIIATIIVGLVTCLVTWVVAKKSLSRRRIDYHLSIYPILDNIKSQSNDIKIYYQDNELEDPFMLLVYITNKGNCAIMNPPIKLSSDGEHDIIPGYFEDVPSGYKDLWTFRKSTYGECFIDVKHINKNQVIKARFFIDRMPSQIPVFSCPMEELVVREIKNSSILFDLDDVLYDIFPFNLLKKIMVILTR